jgi:hypothetical protein
MVNRRPLTEGIKAPASPVDPEMERKFVFNKEEAPAPKSPPSATQSKNRVPFNLRIRADLATALKRASLERQLEGITPNTLQDMLEEALEPWLKTNGYLN